MKSDIRHSPFAIRNSRLPPWLRREKSDLVKIHAVQKSLRGRGLHTVCEEARCPNLAECFARTTATFLLMGPYCTRACRFCNVPNSGDTIQHRVSPNALDPDEPARVAEAAVEWGLRHVVLTSVTRDDLPLGGAAHFAATARALQARLPDATIEMLTPDFLGDERALAEIAAAPLHMFNHNVETAARLYPEVRPQADYRRSLDVLGRFAALRPDVSIKSGFMLGLGETADEIRALLADLLAAQVGAVTIGQYLQPRLTNRPVARYVPPEEFAAWEREARAMGFRRVAAGPLVRSSYHAEKMLDKTMNNEQCTMDNEE
jgi:lipoic acid synthetase